MASFAKIDDVCIQIFDGVDYPSWKLRIMKLLEFKNCKEQATREKASGDNEEQWKKADIKATNYIYSSISNKQLEYVSDLDSACKIMQKFDEIYLSKSTALQIIKRNELESIKLKDYKDVTTFFDKFEKASNELKQAGYTLSDKEKLRFMLGALPSSYSHIGDLIDVLPEKERTVEFLKSKIRMKELEGEKLNRDENSQYGNSSSFSTQVRGGCWTCGRTDHRQAQCPKQQHKNTSSERGRGYYRGRGNQRGFAQQRGSYRGVQQKGRGGPRGRGYTRGGEQDLVNQEEQHASKGNVFVAEVNASEIKSLGNNDVNKVNWILDSGCTDHITNNEAYFENYVTLKKPIEVRLGDGRCLQATKIGNVNVIFDVLGKPSEVNIKNVYYVKEMKQNLLSYSKITENNKIVSIGDYAKIYNLESGNLIARAQKEGKLYHMKCSIMIKNNNEITVDLAKNNSITKKERLHRTLGHVNFKYLEKLCKNELLTGLQNNIETEFLKCATCIECKMSNVPFANNRRKAKEILELIHTDLNGPFHTVGNSGEKYFISIIDDYSKLARVYPIKTKAEVYECFVDYINVVENLTGKKIKTVVCDNGKEYMNANIYRLFREKGITMKPCPPYVHELNGVAERYNRSVMDTARCLLKEADVSRMYWPEIIKAAAYLKNRTLANTLVEKTPYEIFFGEKPDIKYLKIYGSKVYVRIPEQLRNSKWDDKARLGTLLGYTETGYRVLINGKISNVRHVNVIEDGCQVIGLNDENSDEQDLSSEDKEVDKQENLEKTENEIFYESFNETVKNVKASTPKPDGESNFRRTARVPKLNEKYYNDEFETYCVYVNYCDATVPKTYKEAIESKECKQWAKAMNEEIGKINENKSWLLVDLPENENVIDLKWIYTKKDEKTYKARLVAKGFQQVNRLENIYSPVLKLQTLKLLLVYCLQNQLEIEQMDVVAAFLFGKIKSIVYVNQPEGFEKEKNKVYKLLKSLYGLQESPRMWYECFNQYMIEIGFKRSNYDYCLYANNNYKDTIYVLLFVDDLLICCKNKKLIDEIKVKLKERFKMKDIGRIGKYIGIEVKYDSEKGEMSLSQENYIKSLETKYNLIDAKKYNTPMEANLKLYPASEVDVKIKYRNLIGELLYISTGTRPDIAFSVNYLSRFQDSYDETIYKYALRVLKYLCLTKGLKLVYIKREKNEILDCMVDADWAGDCNDRKSTTGFVVRVYGNVIYWRSHKQTTVTKAATFAEYIALSEAVTEVNFIRNMLRETFKVKIDAPIKMYEDNSGAVSIAKFGNFTKNSKHIEVQYHYINEYYEKGIIDIIKVDSDNNIADIFTKSLSRAKFEKFRKMLRLI